MLTHNNTTILTAHGAPRTPTAYPISYVNIIQSKARSQHRKIEHRTKTGPSEHITSAVQNNSRTQIGTQKRHADRKNGPRIAPWAQADGGCRKPRSKSAKAKRMRLKMVALKARCKRGRKRSEREGPCARLPSTTELKPAAFHIYTSARSK